MLLFSLTTISQEVVLDEYFISIENFDFKKSVKLSNKNADPQIRTLLEQYAILSKNEGQSKEFYSLTKIETGENKSIINTLSILVKAKAQISYKQTTTETFNILLNALENSKELNNSTLQIHILWNILNVFKSEIIQINSDYNSFLNQLDNLSKTPLRRAHFSIFNNVFITKSHETSDEDLHIAAKEMDKAFENISNDHKLYPFYSFEKGIYNEIFKNLPQAEENYLNVINSTNDENYYRWVNFGALLKLSKIKELQGFPEEAIKILHNTKKYNDKSAPLESDYYFYSYGSDYYRSLNQKDSALAYLSKAIRLKDEINVIKNALTRSDALVRYRTFEKEKENLVLDNKQKRNRNIAYTLGFSLLLLSIIGVLIYRNTKRKQRIAEQEKELQIQKTTTILKEQEINTINAMIEGQEKERLHIARDLHDNLGGTLAAVKMHIDNLQNNLKSSHNQQELINKANILISEAYQSVRSIAHERNSGVMAKQGLLPAIQKLVNKIFSSNGINVEIQHFGLEERLSNHLEITIFRIIQELVTNVIKHAEATELQISLTQHEKELNIVVEDNGKGFIVGKLQEKDGMGLGSIERRVEHLDGAMLVDSTPNKGTNIIIDLPI